MTDLPADEYFPLLIGYAANAVSALVIVIIAFWASGIARRAIARLGTRHPHLDVTLFAFLGSFARYAILALAGVFVLGRFGIQTTSLAALIGAAGLAIGLAFQGTLSNFASGIMLLAFRPVRNGDYVSVGGHAGTVQEIGIFTLELATIQNVQIIIPNSDVWASSIVNYSAYKTRMTNLVFGVSYDTDLKKAEAVLADIVAADDRTLADPEPWIKVTNLGDFSVDFTVRAWCNRSDYWDYKNDLIRAVKDRFDAEGIDIPFPTQIEIAAN